jgi:hypothetical protein
MSTEKNGETREMIKVVITVIGFLLLCVVFFMAVRYIVSITCGYFGVSPMNALWTDGWICGLFSAWIVKPGK